MNEFNNIKGTIFAMYRFSLHDGPGIRTTIFLKGCPLSCKWCHNPESISPKKELAFFEEKCTLCGACADACPYGAHQIKGQKHLFDRTLCQTCGNCVEACAYDALQMTGEEKNVAEIIHEVEKDISYYQESGGGMTISGGEPMAQPEFTLELLKAATEKNIHTCLDTSGLAKQELYEKVLPFVDLFLFDYKISSSADHKKWTGVSNELIMKNLGFLYNSGANIELRCPVIPGVNDTKDHFRSVVKLELKYPNLSGISIMPYHNTARGKYERYGYKNPLSGITTTDEKKKSEWKNLLKSLGGKKIKIS